jgi:hypothetical protein
LKWFLGLDWVALEKGRRRVSDLATAKVAERVRIQGLLEALDQLGTQMAVQIARCKKQNKTNKNKKEHVVRGEAGIATFAPVNTNYKRQFLSCDEMCRRRERKNKEEKREDKEKKRREEKRKVLLSETRKPRSYPRAWGRPGGALLVGRPSLCR